jgi:hypothetical protein
MDEGRMGIERIARADALWWLLPDYAEDPTVPSYSGGETLLAYDLWLSSRLERIEETADPRYKVAVVKVWVSGPGPEPEEVLVTLSRTDSPPGGSGGQNGQGGDDGEQPATATGGV